MTEEQFNYLKKIIKTGSPLPWIPFGGGIYDANGFPVTLFNPENIEKICTGMNSIPILLKEISKKQIKQIEKTP